ncbi:DegT/DnrJ/EryC1/StrS family aminotransferase (plasmid) [Azospirillum sp. TSA2s]|uniref:DegT/DnrJ/EryC1/StrS family aminotransferase n=1 Tax=Azospirillum sp. TSA2s TaxID=709810 RepID=UPI0010AAE805|nr:DegT/DnrJ/EryC1/StrS family aminotransferase [Azospirillum sp. TSA2s]QCG93034.1 DegT/DnrJ/EryC1/StrS family aminotransferase [Azospirillum sp. TSA2s]
MIPLVNLKRQYASIRADVDKAVSAVLERQHFIKGPEVAAFEKAWCAALGAAHGYGCANGTAALALALEALGIGPGDEVIVPAHTFIASAEAICHVGATPVFADIRASDYTLDANALPLTSRTRAIVPVHIYGTACDMAAISMVAERHGLVVVEDAAQAHLGRFDGQALGTLGDAGSFSFYPGKNLGAYGDAGFVLARDAAVAERIARLIDHGRRSKYLHDIVGYNQRMDELQAAVLRIKLARLEEWTSMRQQGARRYDERLKAAGFKVLEADPRAEPVYHLYVVELANRDETMQRLKTEGIESGVHYPVPLHRQPAFTEFGLRDGALPVTERVAGCVLSLPLCGSITLDEVDQVCDAFLEVARPC